MDDVVKSTIQFELNPELNVEKLSEEFKKNGRVRALNFLQPACAEALYQHLRHNVAWRTFLVASEQLLGTPPGEPVGVNADEEREILDCAYGGARKGGFAYVHDADRLFPEDEADYAPESAAPRVPPADSMLAGFEEFLNTAALRELVCTVTGLQELGSISSQATRFRPGHFVGFHSGTWSADKTRKRRALLSFGLTPDWKPEWGGAQEFRSNDQGIAQSFIPCFNSLEVWGFPMGYWISAVAPFAEVPRFGVMGRVYVP
jgi:SM-20-related protein